MVLHGSRAADPPQEGRASPTGRPDAARLPPYPETVADILFDGGESLEEFGFDAEIVAVPGHTPGSIAVVLPRASLPGLGNRCAAIVGDLVMGGFIFHRWPGLPLFASGMDDLRSSLSKLKSRGVEILLTGHGGPLEAGRVWKRFGI